MTRHVINKLLHLFNRNRRIIHRRRLLLRVAHKHVHLRENHVRRAVDRPRRLLHLAGKRAQLRRHLVQFFPQHADFIVGSGECGFAQVAVRHRRDDADHVPNGVNGRARDKGGNNRPDDKRERRHAEHGFYDFRNGLPLDVFRKAGGQRPDVSLIIGKSALPLIVILLADANGIDFDFFPARDDVLT